MDSLSLSAILMSALTSLDRALAELMKHMSRPNVCLFDWEDQLGAPFPLRMLCSVVCIRSLYGYCKSASTSGTQSRCLLTIYGSSRFPGLRCWPLFRVRAREKGVRPVSVAPSLVTLLTFVVRVNDVAFPWGVRRGHE